MVFVDRHLYIRARIESSFCAMVVVVAVWASLSMENLFSHIFLHMHTVEMFYECRNVRRNERERARTEASNTASKGTQNERAKQFGAHNSRQHFARKYPNKLPGLGAFV